MRRLLDVLDVGAAFMLRPLRAVDGFLGRGINECVFFLVRRGMRRSTIRYALWAIMVLAMAVGVYCDIRMKATGGEIVFDALMLAALVAIQHLNRRWDEALEVGGRAWKPRSNFFWRILGYWNAINYTLQFEGVWPARRKLLEHLRPIYFFAWITFEVAWLLTLFTEETPPNPPTKSPRRVPVPVGAEP